jgi:hypothetical protein
MIYIKVHSTDNGDIIAMCDSSLIDKVLKEGELEINIRDYSDFYKGELVTEQRASEILDPRRVYSANIIGKESIRVAIKKKILDKNSVRKVKDIPYANIFKIKY